MGINIQDKTKEHQRFRETQDISYLRRDVDQKPTEIRGYIERTFILDSDINKSTHWELMDAWGIVSPQTLVEELVQAGYIKVDGIGTIVENLTLYKNGLKDSENFYFVDKLGAKFCIKPQTIKNGIIKMLEFSFSSNEQRTDYFTNGATTILVYQNKAGTESRVRIWKSLKYKTKYHFESNEKLREILDNCTSALLYLHNSIQLGIFPRNNGKPAERDTYLVFVAIKKWAEANGYYYPFIHNTVWHFEGLYNRTREDLEQIEQELFMKEDLRYHDVRRRKVS